MSNSPTVVIIASTMRSGSTLLKALLAEADDVSNLPETNFQRPKTVDQILSDHQDGKPPIKVLKKPCWYQEYRSYPRLPQNRPCKTIALVRDVYDTVRSLRKMTFRSLAPLAAPCVTRWLCRTYWANVTGSLVTLAKHDTENTMLLRYEDLVGDPIEKTKELYQFIGSSRTDGTKRYSAPDSFSWRWGSDDGSSNIRSLEVQPPGKSERNEGRILRAMEDESIVQLRRELGYLS